MWYRPHAIATKPAQVGSSSRWWLELQPHVTTVPSSRSPTVWYRPHAIATKPAQVGASSRWPS
eukprot:CAMPEP_0118914276 /NCGR_PEP_ID=MMETSP1166-20130328/14686_1 /TAXON_ID=1104430 /ORGANISM="Chrysoreinhardia sp, Strain CCMP3193" /LENGTH=62 /DNA_ID=CAMNT_0006853847 /DNA_START=176 /DNA_END=360 /DNA_ORIENTATION=+